MYKGGQITIFMTLLLVGLFFALIFILVGGIATVEINNALNKSLVVGQVNMQNISSDTIGQFTVMYLNNADWWGISAIFGMVIGLFLSAYFTRNTFPKWGLVLDIFIIIFIFIISLYLSSAYGAMLDALSDTGQDFLEVYVSRSSMFMLNLPIFVVIIGAISMILFHSSIPKRTEERFQSGGQLQGI